MLKTLLRAVHISSFVLFASYHCHPIALFFYFIIIICDSFGRNNKYKVIFDQILGVTVTLMAYIVVKSTGGTASTGILSLWLLPLRYVIINWSLAFGTTVSFAMWTVFWVQENFMGITFTTLKNPWLSLYLAFYMIVQGSLVLSIMLKATREAEQQSHEKTNYLATMSHEIRTILTTILGWTDILLSLDNDSDNAPKKVTQGLGTIQHAGVLLLNLINDILDFSKIESSQFSLEKSVFDLRESVNFSCSAHSVLIENKGLKFTQNINVNEPFVVGDKFRLNQCINNLLSNATKFTPSGEITFFCEEIPSNTSADRCFRIGVKDTGIGMSPEARDKILQLKPFVQAVGSTTRLYGGSGLGLCITGRLVSLMGGKVDVQSTEKAGTTVTFTMKMGKASETGIKELIKQKKSRSRCSSCSSARYSVLLVEDNEVIQKIVKKMVESIGHKCEVASDGIQAISAAASRRFDIILMDLHMPNLGGVEATREIRKAERTRASLSSSSSPLFSPTIINNISSVSSHSTPTPSSRASGSASAGIPSSSGISASAGISSSPRKSHIIALTASADSSTQAIVLGCGMDKFLTKPITVEKLKEIFDEICGHPDENSNHTCNHVNNSSSNRNNNNYNFSNQKISIPHNLNTTEKTGKCSDDCVRNTNNNNNKISNDDNDGDNNETTTTNTKIFSGLIK